MNLKRDKKTENEIIEMLESYSNAYANKNLDAMMELFLDSPDIVAIGTGTDEWGKDSIVEAIVKFKNIVNTSDCTFTLEGFEKALEIKNKRVEELQKQLDIMK